MTDDQSGVEVIVHRFLESRFEAACPVAQLCNLFPLRLIAPRLRLRHKVTGVRQGLIKTGQAEACFVKILIREVDGGTVVGGEDEEAQHFGVVSLENVANGEEVAEGLAHLLMIDIDKAVVQPVLDKGFAGRPFALGDFIFMMGEDQVFTAAVDVESLAEVLYAHRRTFDVPAGTPRAPGGFPGRLSGFGAFPQGKVHGMAFEFSRRNTGAGAHFIHIALGEFQVVREALDRVIDIAAAGVGAAASDQTLHQGDDLADMLGRLRLDRRFQQAEGRHIFVKGADKLFGEEGAVDAAFVGAIDDFVVDVGVVADIGDVISGKLQIAVDDVKDDVGAGMTDMAVVINSNAADVHADVSRPQRHKLFFAATQGIIKTQRHENSWEGSRQSGAGVPFLA